MDIVVNCMNLSKNGKRLIKLYKDMAKNGFDRTDGTRVESKNAYNSFQLKKFKHVVLPSFKKLKIKTVLDYGGGGSNWDELNFDPQTGMSAKEFLQLRQVKTFEPARDLNEKEKSDCVVCIDVMEHIFLADVSNVIRELFSLAEKLVVINVACYPAAALLPNGENAHITVRNPDWWSGVLTAISKDFPEIETVLICSETFVSGKIYQNFKSADWDNSKTFTIKDNYIRFGETSVPRNLTIEEVCAAVDQMTKRHPKTGTLLLNLLKKNIPFMNQNLFK